MKLKYSEGIIQSMIWVKLNRKPLFCNVFTGCNEWDAFYISPAGYATGYEIKLSKSDLRADFKKDRHELLLQRKPVSDNKYGPKLGALIKYFYYVCAGFDVDVSEIPEYAGLMIVDQYSYLSVKKNAPVLWKEKVNEKIITNLYITLGKRYMYKKFEKHRKELREYKETERGNRGMLHY